MNVVREIHRINQAELDIAITNPSASWHQQYRDSAYIFVGGLPYELTEADVITIFSQYGEVVDVHLPRASASASASTSTSDTSKGNDGKQEARGGSKTHNSKPGDSGRAKHRGFGFVMYEHQHSTVLAVDNLNGAHVLGRTLRVDHVAKYEQPPTKDQHGKWTKPQHKSLNAAPQPIGHADHDQDQDERANDDLDDPMAAYFAQKRKREREREPEEKRGDDKHERRTRKEERARIRAEREHKRSKHKRRKHSHPGSSKHTDQRRHHSRRRSTDDDDSEGEDQRANRYELVKKKPSILDVDSRPSSPPSSHRREREDDRDRNRDRRNRDRRHRSSHHHSSSRRRSRSP